MTSHSHTIVPLNQYLEQLAQLIKARLDHHFKGIADLQLSHLSLQNGIKSPLTSFISSHRLKPEDCFILLLGLAPHVQPDFFDSIIQHNIPNAGDFPQLGGTRGKHFRGFLPTGETALFLLGGIDLRKRFEIQKSFGEDHLFAKKRILWLEEPPVGEPRMSGRIVMSQEIVDLLTQGIVSRPRFSLSFPAQLVETAMDWQDLVLNNDTLQQVKELETYLRHGNTLLYKWGMEKKLKPGFRVLFHGPPGTGKTLTASLLGKYTGKDTYKIDLSMVVSKYIGETEKNLANLFAKAENKDWILFFDEADALFGKRTNVRDAHDKYANQEVSYLLQRVENYNGLVILATNFLSNIDDAFRRRFQAIISFPFPGINERLKIWRKAFPPFVEFSPDIDFAMIAQKYELSGAEIMNVVQYCCLRALERGDQNITASDIIIGVKKEFLKEGKILN